MWVSVKDRLPKKAGRYLVVTELGYLGEWITIVFFAPIAEEYSYDFKGNKNPIFYGHDSEWGDLEYDNVTHWQPLPELPEEEE